MMVRKHQEKPKKRLKPSYERTDWVFDWKRSEATPIGTWVSVFIVGFIFFFLIFGLRIKLVEPIDLRAPQASLIRLSDESWSQALAAKARAKSPFPSRFEPKKWLGTATMRSIIADSAQPRMMPHQPLLMPFPEPGIQLSRMARRGEPVLPERSRPSDVDYGVENLRLAPVISALDGITSAELPKTLPEWNDPVSDLLASRSWRFLVELEGSGRVRECVALAGGNERSPSELTDWLRGAVFQAKPRQGAFRWVAVAVQFQNQSE